VLRVFGGSIPSGVSREQAIDVVVESLCAVADHAGERSVKICMETHDDWCDPAHVAAVLERVDHAAVGVNWDVMHPVRTGAATIEKSFEILKPWVYHLHIHDGVGGDVGLVPIGTGDIDHKAVLECLQTVEYTGYLSGEWINWEAYDIHLPRELAAMKRYEQALG
jgi:sugar phosphate isomerase/epimerase